MTVGGPDRKAESDVQKDPDRAATRETGGVADPEHPDQHTTTGTTPSGTFVGRVAGEDVGADEESGAERRAANQRQERQERQERQDGERA